MSEFLCIYYLLLVHETINKKLNFYKINSCLLYFSKQQDWKLILTKLVNSSGEWGNAIDFMCTILGCCMKHILNRNILSLKVLKSRKRQCENVSVPRAGNSS